MTLCRLSQPKMKCLLIAGAVAGIVVYGFLLRWVYQYATNSRSSAQTTRVPVSDQDKKSFFSNMLPIRNNSPDSMQRTSSALPSPTPTPTPIQGPGQYACDPEGTCKNYSDNVRKAKCQETFADPGCLERCGNVSIRCKP